MVVVVMVVVVSVGCQMPKIAPALPFAASGQWPMHTSCFSPMLHLPMCRAACEFLPAARTAAGGVVSLLSVQVRVVRRWMSLCRNLGALACLAGLMPGCILVTWPAVTQHLKERDCDGWDGLGQVTCRSRPTSTMIIMLERPSACSVCSAWECLQPSNCQRSKCNQATATTGASCLIRSQKL